MIFVQSAHWQLSISKARGDEKKIVHIGIAHIFAVLHDISVFCVLTIHNQILWKKPYFGSLQGHKSVKIAPHNYKDWPEVCPWQGRMPMDAYFSEQEGSSEKWVSVSSLIQQCWANQLLSQVLVLLFVKCDISYHCLPFLFRLFALQGNIYHVPSTVVHLHNG